MYKVFFNDRTVYFSDSFDTVLRNKKGLFYRVETLERLPQLVEQFSRLNHLKVLYLIHPDLARLASAFVSCFTPIMAGGGLVFNQKKEFLIILRKGIWDLPKGKLEPGEDFQEAALREVEEETGLKGLVARQPLTSTFHTYDLGSKKVLKQTRWFEMTYLGKAKPRVELEEQITSYKWVSPGDTAFIRENSYPSILDVLTVSRVL